MASCFIHRKIPTPFLVTGLFLTWAVPIPPRPASTTSLQTQERHRTLTHGKSVPISGLCCLLIPLDVLLRKWIMAASTHDDFGSFLTNTTSLIFS